MQNEPDGDGLNHIEPLRKSILRMTSQNKPVDQSARAPMTIVIPTRNEERNLPETLRAIEGWAEDVFVLDSFSEDRTCEIAREHGAIVVQHKFLNFSAQKNWALDNLPFRTEWVFFLDADMRPTPALRQEVVRVLNERPESFDGYFVSMQICFMNRWLRHGGVCPNWSLRLFKYHLGRYEERLVHEHILLKGNAGYLHSDLLHNDYKDLDRYFERHNVYSSMEAVEVFRFLDGTGGENLQPSFWRRGPERRRVLKQLAYRYLPCRPLVKFLWMYFVRAGFLDGRAGFRYCLLQTFYEYQVSLKLMELRSSASSPLLRHELQRTMATAPFPGDESLESTKISPARSE